ncbi:ECF transporter S component [Serinibacter salmoneus]|uniref:Energy-coupling factor transport system ATP-binding protein/energy-coupling factor transport system substrate-specific component n=1 Tax=Serinibacter salmoneus TaxID=556530 RepID=A0A2A9D286_9MICO|nr:ECF transporter S component [Serinibacter salmoneus]PFG19969.1 energy-coupling factor transport system ATP-binding protein/energy-coupling factor transport system substrate-specific component [Serinibacter salmoneus]
MSAPSAPSAPAAPSQGASARRWPGVLALATTNLIAALAFAWPLLAPAAPSQARAAVPYAALALVPLLVLLAVVMLDGSLRSARTLAMLGTLTAVGAAVRIAGTGAGGVELVFIVLILAGRAYGARFAYLLGVLVIAVSSLVSGFGPWTPFQMMACAWVGAGAGLLPARLRGRAEIAALAAYGALASFGFGLAMNLWFWPFAIGSGASISYDGDAGLGTNLASFLAYSLVTSTLTWDLVRAVTTVVGVCLAGPAVLAALRRARLG